MGPLGLVEQCAPGAPAALMKAVVSAESGWRPLAIGMDAGQPPIPQPLHLADAIKIAEDLSRQGRGFSVGLAQVHVTNVRRHGLRWEQAFDPCSNLALGQRILRDFQERAAAAGFTGAAALRAALRGYNAGRIDSAVAGGYAARVISYMDRGATSSGQVDPSPVRGTGARTCLQSASERLPAARCRDAFANETPDVFAKAAATGGL